MPHALVASPQQTKTNASIGLGKHCLNFIMIFHHLVINRGFRHREIWTRSIEHYEPSIPLHKGCPMMFGCRWDHSRGNQNRMMNMAKGSAGGNNSDTRGDEQLFYLLLPAPLESKWGKDGLSPLRFWHRSYIKHWRELAALTPHSEGDGWRLEGGAWSIWTRERYPLPWTSIWGINRINGICFSLICTPLDSGSDHAKVKVTWRKSENGPRHEKGIRSLTLIFTTRTLLIPIREDCCLPKMVLCEKKRRMGHSLAMHGYTWFMKTVTTKIMCDISQSPQKGQNAHEELRYSWPFGEYASLLKGGYTKVQWHYLQCPKIGLDWSRSWRISPIK